MGRRRIGVGFATAVLLGTLAAPAAVASPTHVDVIVQFVDGTQDARGTANDVARQHRATPTFVYEHALQGFAGSMPASRVEALRRDPRVAHVEFDQEVSIAAQQVPTGIRRIFADTNTAIGIDGPETFIDADVAVIDTGIDAAHPDLNVVQSVNCMNHSGGPPFRRTYYCATGGTDGNGHGTHVAGTIAARNNGSGVVGVAPGARLHAVRVLDNSGSGSNATVIAGIDWVTGQGNIEVANLSLGGSPSSAVDSALDKLAQSGVAIALAAGNSATNVSNVGPAGHRWSLTVSALADYDGKPGAHASPTCSDRGPDDTLATFSNFGVGVDVAAPGVCIRSTVPGGGYATYNGTSMAAPHVAGALALLASNTPNGSGKGLTAVQGHYSTVLSNGNQDWTDTSGDGFHEPLLDVSSTGVYNPATGPSNGGGGTDPTDPDPTDPDPTDPGAGDFDLSATAYKVRGVQHADLSWSDAGSSNVDIVRDGTKIATVSNSGAHTDDIGNRGGGSYSYQVCEAGTSTCSNTVTVTF